MAYKLLRTRSDSLCSTQLYTEQYLNGGIVTVAYNPDDVTEVWMIENGNYIIFTLIESRYVGKDFSDVLNIRERQKNLISSEKKTSLQAKIDLIEHISVISEKNVNQGNVKIQGIRDNRKREQQKTHIDYIKRGESDE